MPEYKKQHTVPKFYLKRFSIDEENINIWNIPKEKKIENVPLKNQCYEDYRYGKDTLIEKELSKIEDIASEILEKISRDNVLPIKGTSEHKDISRWVSLQMGRVKSASDNALRTMKPVSDRIRGDIVEIRSNIEAQGLAVNIEEGLLDPFPEKGSKLNLLALKPYLQRGVWGGIYNRDYVLLINESGTGFITSDSPVVLYNLAEPLRKIGPHISLYTNLGARGLGIFYPICSRKAVLFFDHRTHKARRREGDIIEIDDETDVLEINKLQVCFASENAYFRNQNFNIELVHRMGMDFKERIHNEVNSLHRNEVSKREPSLQLSFLESSDY